TYSITLGFSLLSEGWLVVTHSDPSHKQYKHQKLTSAGLQRRREPIGSPYVKPSSSLGTSREVIRTKQAFRTVPECSQLCRGLSYSLDVVCRPSVYSVL